MNNPDHDIEKLLAALRDVEPPPEIERRILQTLHQRSAAHTTSHSRSLRWVTPRPWIVATAVAGTAAACLAVFVFHRAAQAPPAHQLSHVTSFEPSPATISNEAIPPPRQTSPPITKVKPHPQAVTSADSLELAEMHAPSHPAPPMPLTEQERLLLRIARSGGQQELVALNADIRAKLEADDAADFQNFFEPAHRQPKPADNE